MMHVLMLVFITAISLPVLAGAAWLVVWCTGKGPDWIYASGPAERRSPRDHHPIARRDQRPHHRHRR